MAGTLVHPRGSLLWRSSFPGEFWKACDPGQLPNTYAFRFSLMGLKMPEHRGRRELSAPSPPVPGRPQAGGGWVGEGSGQARVVSVRIQSGSSAPTTPGNHVQGLLLGRLLPLHSEHLAFLDLVWILDSKGH